MVKISNIDIENFKFYIEESIDINSKNFLIYGENGVGKSSLYLSLYYLFYGYFDNTLLDNIQEFEHRGIPNQEDIKITVNFSNDEFIKIINNDISNTSTLVQKENIYFLDYQFLESFINKSDFFITLNKIKNKFLLFDDIFSNLSHIENNKDTEEYDLLINKRINLDNQITEKMAKIEVSANEIIKELKENFSIKLIFEESALDREAIGISFYNPKVFIEIDGYRNLKLHFNESKIKILSLALIFSIIKLNQEEFPSSNDTNLKLLVLDDFLSSLDMGNRLYIMEYIFNNFPDYQIIILTHNLSFFSIIKRLIHVHGQVNEWEYKNIYKSLREDGSHEPKFFKRNDNYLIEANTAFKESDFEGCGNLLRKEIERIISQAEFLFQTGKKEKLENAIVNIRKKNRHYINPNDTLGEMEEFFTQFKEKTFPKDEQALAMLKNKLTYFFNKNHIDSEKLNEILQNINFYQTILNKASHHGDENDFFQKEYREALSDVRKLKNIFDEFHKLQNQ